MKLALAGLLALAAAEFTIPEIPFAELGGLHTGPKAMTADEIEESKTENAFAIMDNDPAVVRKGD